MIGSSFVSSLHLLPQWSTWETGGEMERRVLLRYMLLFSPKTSSSFWAVIQQNWFGEKRARAEQQQEQREGKKKDVWRLYKLQPNLSQMMLCLCTLWTSHRAEKHFAKRPNTYSLQTHAKIWLKRILNNLFRWCGGSQSLAWVPWRCTAGEAQVTAFILEVCLYIIWLFTNWGHFALIVYVLMFTSGKGSKKCETAEVRIWNWPVKAVKARFQF